ncbi:Hypothetical protein FKW44_008329 [Caligus rogercresseyi]|uniref:Uncharacterized protein n=1 Tax=Caligus rogercresseyi TaxID=217165 RepID=A0A7T8KFY5_CALRO|nr:Hypothetical protein FKW44_008329 [Caligus rogercresseyi]
MEGICLQHLDVVSCLEPESCRDQMSGAAVPLEVTNPKDIALAGCFVVVRVRADLSISQKLR